jgi:glyoxylase-like metal-dependent hydrolase (beta-lactamase superfamily II)
MIRRLLCVLALAQPLAAQPELAAARGLIHAVPGDLPTAIGYLNVAEWLYPLSEEVENAPKTMLTRAQMESLLHNTKMTLTPFDSARAGRYIVFDCDRELPIAPGVVLIKAPGHTPGSQVVYVKLASGREVILSGDVTLNHVGIETEKERPDPAHRIGAADRAAIAGELAWLHEAERAGVSVVVSHDEEQIKAFARQGILSEGLATR